MPKSTRSSLWNHTTAPLTLAGAWISLAFCVLSAASAGKCGAQSPMIINVGCPGGVVNGQIVDDRQTIQSAIDAAVAFRIANPHGPQVIINFPSSGCSGPIEYNVLTALPSQNQDLLWHLQADVAFPDYIDRISFYGNGARIKFYDRSAGGLGLARLKNFVIYGLSIEYATKSFTQGRIVGLDLVNGAFIDVELDEGYPSPVAVPNPLCNPTDSYFDPSLMAPNDNNYFVTIYDPETRKLKVGSEEYGLGHAIDNGVLSPSIVVTALPPSAQSCSTVAGLKNVIRLTFASFHQMVRSYFLQNMGDLVAIRRYQANSPAAIRIVGSRYGVVYQAEISSAPGFAIQNRSNEAMLFYQVNVAPKNGDDGLISVGRDGITSLNGRASIDPLWPNSIEIVQCSISSNCDDAISVDSTTGELASINTATGVVGFNLIGVSPEDLLWNASPGVPWEIEVYDGTTSRVRGSCALQSVYFSMPNLRWEALVASVPAGTSVGDHFLPKSLMHNNFRIVDNSISGNRARGILLMAHSGIVSGNYIDGSSFSGILAGIEPFGGSRLFPFCEDIEIMDNYIRNTNFSIQNRIASSAASGAIAVSDDVAGSLGNAWPNARDHKNIQIHDNIIDGAGVAGIFVASASNVTIERNVLLNMNQRWNSAIGSSVGVANLHAGIHIQNVDGVVLSANIGEDHASIHPLYDTYDVAHNGTTNAQVFVGQTVELFDFEAGETSLFVDPITGPYAATGAQLSGLGQYAWTESLGAWTSAGWYPIDSPEFMFGRQFLAAYENGATITFSNLTSMLWLTLYVQVSSLSLQNPVFDNSALVIEARSSSSPNGSWTNLATITNDATSAFSAFENRFLAFNLPGTPGFANPLPSAPFDLRLRLASVSGAVLFSVDRIGIRRQ